MPLYLVQLEKRSTLLHARVRRMWRVSGAWTLFTATRLNPSLTVELDNRSLPNLSRISYTNWICSNLGLLSRRSVSQSFWSVVKTRTGLCFFKAGPNNGGIVPDNTVILMKLSYESTVLCFFVIRVLPDSVNFIPEVLRAIADRISRNSG